MCLRISPIGARRLRRSWREECATRRAGGAPIGDLSANICARTIELAREARIAIPHTMLQMARRIELLLGKTLDALVQRDVALARRVLAEDREVDELFARLLGELKQAIREDIERLDSLIIVFTVARYLERMADRMTNICEAVIYMVEGEIVRHQDPSAVDELLERELGTTREL